MSSFAPQWRRICGESGVFARSGSIPWGLFRLLDTPIPLDSEQVMPGHEEIGQGGHHEQAVAVPHQASIGHLGKAEHALDDKEGMLDPGPHLRGGLGCPTFEIRPRPVWAVAPEANG